MNHAVDESGLAGGVAVITGAANGIGKGIARAAAAQGMTLVLADIAREPLEAFARELEAAGTTVRARHVDVTDAAALEALAAETFARFGAVRWLVNNAGVEAVGRLWELPAPVLERTVDINILGPMLAVRAFVPRMIASGAPGFVTNLSSSGGLAMMPMQGAYIMSKHAVLSFSECLALDCAQAAPFLTVSVVLPGAVRTGIFAAAGSTADPDARDHSAQMDAMLEDQGLSADEAGRMILTQVDAGEFWIATHPDLLKQVASERTRYLSEARRPALSNRTARFFDQPQDG